VLSRLRMNSEGEDAASKESAAESGEILDPAQKKEKALQIRKVAGELEESASMLRKSAMEKEQEAAKLRIQAWQLEGTVSKVTKQVTIEDDYERQLAELDLMAEDWTELDQEKWEWYQKQRQIMKELLDTQKELDSEKDALIEDLKETLLEVQTLLNVQTVDDKGNITTAGLAFVFLSFLIPLWFGYEIFHFLSESSVAIFGTLTNKDEFSGL